MPRMHRLQAPGALVHIIARGIDGMTLFKCDEDRQTFLASFGVLLAKTRCKCLTWCLMDNHYHLLLRSTDLPLAKLMRPLNGLYARWYNRKYSRRGYLFQDRFKSIVCQDQEYARQIIRYINLNPIRGGIVSSLAGLRRFKWCGHRRIIGAPSPIGESFQDIGEVLRRFGPTEQEARCGYADYLKEAVGGADAKTAGYLDVLSKTEISGSFKGWPSVIGDPDFARRALEKFKKGRIRKHRKCDYVKILGNLSKELCEKYGVEKSELFRRGKNNLRSEIRSHFASRAHLKELIPMGEIADFLGITISPVARLVSKKRNQSA
jgi:putative transposase